MIRVVIESPFAGDRPRNKMYALEAMYDCLKRGEAPFAPHLLYTQILDDNIPIERKLGMAAGFAWSAMAHLVAVYTDLGVSAGMKEGVAWATGLQIPVVYRTIRGAVKCL